MTGYIPRWFICPQMVTRPGSNPAVLGQESNSQPVDYESSTLTTTSPSHQELLECDVKQSVQILFCGCVSDDVQWLGVDRKPEG